MRKLGLISLFLLLQFCSYTQNYRVETSFWKLTSFDGEFNLEGVYLDQKIDRNAFNEHITRSYISGGLFFNSTSYFWHPNFMVVTLDAGYSPETGQELSLVAPDRSEVNTLKKLNTSIWLLQNNKVNLKAFTNLHEGFSNRENLTNIKTKSVDWGSVFSYRNKALPFTVSYNKKKIEQTELANDRTYRIESSNLQARTSKSFGINDNHLFTVSQNNYSYNDNFLIPDESELGNLVKNNITNWRLRNNIFFDTNKKYRFNSTISSENQKGSYFNYRRLQVLETLTLKLPVNFNLLGNYSYFNIKTNVEESKQQFIRGALTHQLYKSLRTKATLEFNDINSSQYQEKDQRAGLLINYVKKIPFKGLLTISYSLKSNLKNRASAHAFLNIQNEEYTLNDSQMVLLNEQNINIESIVVKDETGTLIYQLYFDYILIERNELIEIQRIPGGNIPDNAIVNIDYTATQPRSFEYNAIHKNLFASISLFNKKIEVYLKNSSQDFIDPKNVDFLTLDYFDQKVYGARINFGFINGGIEQDNLNSTIIPYRLRRYYLVLQGKIKHRMVFTLNGTIRHYQMIIQEGTKQQYYNLTGTASYIINSRTKLNLNGSYLEQSGAGIELNLITSRLEFSTRFLQVYIKASVELYQSNFYTEKLDYKKFAIQISRKF